MQIKTLADILKTTKLSQRMMEQASISANLSKIIQSSGVPKQFNSMMLHESVLKGLSASNNIKNFTSYSNIAKIAALQHSKVIPATTLGTLNSIASSQTNLLNSLKGFDKVNSPSSIIAQIQNFQLSFQGISSNLAKIALEQKKWDLLEDFDEISANAAAINEAIDEDDGITEKNLEEIKNLLHSIEVKFDRQDKNVIEILFKFIALISFIITIRGVIKEYEPRPNYATKEEISLIVKDGFEKIQKSLEENERNEKVRIKCKVMLKPRNRSKVIAYLPANYDLIVLNKFHKWAYISYLNPKDGLPETGWIKKKYLLERK